MPRTSWSFLAALLLLAGTVTAAPPNPPGADRINARIAHDVQWFRSTLQSSKCPAAADALEAAARSWSDDPSRSGDEEERAWQVSKKAVKAGCDDARVLYVYARMYDSAAKETAEESTRLARAAAAALDRSDARAMLKVMGHVRAAQRIIAEARAKKANSAPGAAEQLDAAATQWLEAAKDPDIPQTYLADAFQAYLDSRRDLVQDRRTYATPILEAFAKKPALQQLLRARLAIDLAWDARGNRSIDKTSDTAQKVFASRLGEAETETLKLAKLDPTSAVVGPFMLAVLLGTECDRATLDAWFRYALTLDPGSSDPWFARLHHLEPRWHGSAEEMIEVGREALATKQFAYRVPFVLVFAHQQLADDDPSHFDDPAVCRDVRAVFDPYLKEHPDALYERSGYAYFLYRCEDFTGANREIKRLGSERRLGPFQTKAAFDKIKVEAALNAH
ncbi:MAG TPA: hypothetical protein VHW00_21980 [Thermoanaerobaculia bacterium]|nr:hypothetical protein [Thermoanaerobaculia bacterium]